jgi:hypothetical protein
MLESRCEFLPISFWVAPGGGARIRTGDQGFAGPCLTTWLRRLEGLHSGKSPHISASEDCGSQDVPARPSCVNRIAATDHSGRLELGTKGSFAADRNDATIPFDFDFL